MRLSVRPPLEESLQRCSSASITAEAATFPNPQLRDVQIDTATYYKPKPFG